MKPRLALGEAIARKTSRGDRNDRTQSMINELVELAVNAAVEVAGEVVISAVGEAVAQTIHPQPEPIEAVSGRFGEIFAVMGDQDAPEGDRDASASA